MYQPKEYELISRKRYHQARHNVQRHKESYARATEIVGKIYAISYEERVMMCTFNGIRWKNYLTTVRYFHKHYLQRYERDLNSEILLIECIVDFRCDVKSRTFYNPTLHQPIDTIKSHLYS